MGVFLFSNVTKVEFSQGLGNKGANLILFKKIWIIENLWELWFTTCAQSELRGQTYDTTIICMTFAPLKVLPDGGQKGSKFINKKLPKQIWYNKINIILLYSKLIKIYKMKNLFVYSSLLVTSIFFVYCSLTMDIPTYNQIGGFLMGILSFTLLLIVFVCDVQSVLNKKSKPQKF